MSTQRRDRIRRVRSTPRALPEAVAQYLSYDRAVQSRSGMTTVVLIGGPLVFAAALMLGGFGSASALGLATVIMLVGLFGAGLVDRRKMWRIYRHGQITEACDAEVRLLAGRLLVSYAYEVGGRRYRGRMFEHDPRIVVQAHTAPLRILVFYEPAKPRHHVAVREDLVEAGKRY